MNRYVLALCMSSFASTAIGATYAKVEEFLAAVPGLAAEQSLVARGDLNRDGTEDAAVAAITSSGGEQRFQLFVLLKSKTGEFSIAESSSQTEIPGAGCCGIRDIGIANGSIYIEIYMGTYSNHATEIDQFMLHKGAWRLVGVKTTSTNSEGAKEFHDRATNVLTGVTNHSRKSIGKSASRWKTHFPVRAYSLKDYRFGYDWGLFN